MSAGAVPVAHVAGPFRCVESSAPSPSGQLYYRTNCPNASGCLATQAARVQPGCSSSLHRGSKRTDIGWLSKQRLGPNALAESSNNVVRVGGRVANARAVMMPVRQRETSLGDSGDGASLRTIEGVSSPGTSGQGLVNARGNRIITQTMSENTDAAEARAGLRAAGAVEYDPTILSRRFSSQPLKVESLKCKRFHYIMGSNIHVKYSLREPSRLPESARQSLRICIKNVLLRRALKVSSLMLLTCYPESDGFDYCDMRS